MTRKLVPVLAVAVLLSSGWLAWNLTLPTYSPSRTRALNSAGGGGPAPAGAGESESPPTAPPPAMATGGWRYYAKGFTGFGTRTLIRLARGFGKR